MGAQNGHDKYDTTQDLRRVLKSLQKEARSMQSHLKRMLDEYGDFEDRINALDAALEQAEKDYGITKEEVFEPDPLDDFIDT